MESIALICPDSGAPLRRCSREDAEAAVGSTLVPLRRPGSTASGRPAVAPVGVTAEVLLRQDDLIAYPIVDGTPVTLVPEMLGSAGGQRDFDLTDPRYAEAYDEMEFYNAEATEVGEGGRLEKIAGSSGFGKGAFPDPPGLWLSAVFDCVAQQDAYRHMTPLEGGRFLQLGGKGGHAIAFLLAGAAEAWNLSPMIGEAHHAQVVARRVGVADRLHTVAGVAEQLPFPDGSFDGIYAGGCLHHMVTDMALPEVARVLKPGGRFAAVEPWKTPIYDLGIRVFGKREANSYCRPLTPERVAPMSGAFANARISHHGAILRYPLIVLSKFGLSVGVRSGLRLQTLDDAISSFLRIRHFGGSVAVIATKSG